MDELKPCPFCDEPLIVINSNGGFIYQHHSVDCPISNFTETGNNWMKKEELINSLNYRPIEDALRAENERLQKQLDVERPTGICEICTEKTIKENERLRKLINECHAYVFGICQGNQNNEFALRLLEKLSSALEEK
jgi:hypothetical protein